MVFVYQQNTSKLKGDNISELPVSVIVPVYNTQEYIIECLEFIKNQIYPNIEVIIVNDGSTDNSPKIIRDFIQDNNLNYFHLLDRENGGLSSARNFGLKHAKGEWIVFVDSDDWLEPNYVESMMRADDKYKADFYLAGFRAYDINTKQFEVWSNYNVDYGTIPEDLKLLNSVDYIWARVYKKSIIDEHALFFDERIRFCEDNAFNFDYISIIKSFASVDDIGYNYRRGHSGAMSRQLVTPQMRKHVTEHMYGFCDKLTYDSVISALNENKSMLRVMWNTFITAVVLDVLDKNHSEAKQRMKHTIAVSVVKAYKPYNKKDKVLRFLWKKPYCIFKLFINLFYKNIERIKKHKGFLHYLTN